MLVIGVVALLTLLFSFLGTLSSAALLGMMFSAIKQSKWRIVLISFVFPLISAGFSGGLTPERNLALASICFGVFWTSYLITCGTLYLERRETGEAAPGVSPQAGAVVPQPAANPDLNELQGDWERDGPAQDRLCPAERIQVLRDQLLVIVSGADGKPETKCCGLVQVTHAGPFKVATLSPTQLNGCATRAGFCTGAWLFKASGQTLTLAWNFDDSAQAPVVEKFRRRPSPG